MISLFGGSLLRSMFITNNFRDCGFLGYMDVAVNVLRGRNVAGALSGRHRAGKSDSRDGIARGQCLDHNGQGEYDELDLDPG